MTDSNLVHSYNGQFNYENELSALNFSKVLEKSIENEECFISIHEKLKKPEKISHAEFVQKSIKCSGVILSKLPSLNPGDKVSVLMGNSLEAFITYTALLYLKLVIVPINPDETAEYIENIFKLSDSKLMLALNQYKDKVTEIDPALFINEIDIDSFSGPDFSSSEQNDLNELAAIFYTSGTTGNPKGVMLTLGNLLINSEATKRVHSLTPKSVHMSVLPLFHVNAFNFTFLTSLYVGCKTVYQPSYFPLNFWKIIEAEKVEVVSATPHIIRLINSQENRQTIDTSHLKYFVTAAAPLKKDDLKQFMQNTGIKIYQAYGLSETVNFSLTTPPELTDSEYDEVMFSEPAPTAGSPVFGNDMSIVDPQSGKVQPENVQGEIVIRGWNVMSGYFQNEKATKEAFQGNVFHTGDIGYYKAINGKDFFYICGRLKETAKRLGFLSYLADIDILMQNHKGLEQAYAVSFENDYTGEEIGLFLIRNASTPSSHQEILDLFQKLPSHKRPRVIVEGSELPLTSTGKLKRNQLSPLFTEFKSTHFK